MRAIDFLKSDTPTAKAFLNESARAKDYLSDEDIRRYAKPLEIANEAARTLVAGAAAFPAAGLAGLIGGVTGEADEEGNLKSIGFSGRKAAEAFLDVNEAFDQKPSKEAEAIVGKIMYPFEKLSEGASAVQKRVTEDLSGFEHLGVSPDTIKAIGASAGTAVEFGGLMLAPKVVGKAGSGAKRVVQAPGELKRLEGPYGEVAMPERTAASARQFLKDEKVKVAEEPVQAREFLKEEPKVEPVAEPVAEAVKPQEQNPSLQWWMEDRGIYGGGSRMGQNEYIIERGKGGFVVEVWEQDAKGNIYYRKIGSAKKLDEAKKIAEEHKYPVQETAAKAQEPAAPTDVRPTSAKNAVTTHERAELGLDPVESEVRRSVPMFEEGKRQIDEGRDPRALAQAIVDKNELISHTDAPIIQGILANDRMRLRNEYKAVSEAVDKAIDAGDTLAVEAGKRTLERIEADTVTNETALKRTGTAWHEMGKMRQLMVADDYSVLEMKRKYKRDTGREMPPELQEKVKKLNEQLDDLNRQIEEKQNKNAALSAEATIKQIEADVAKEQRQTRRRAAKQELAVEFDSLVKELNKTLGGQLNVGLDPTAIAIIGKMAKNRVQSGYITVEALVDNIYTAIKKTGLEVSKRDIRDAISGYGATPRDITRNEAVAQLSELKKQMRLVSKLEDAQKGIAPQRSGAKAEKSAEVKELERQVKQAMIDSGLVEKATPDEIALKQYKTRTKNRIAELEDKLQRGDFTKKAKREVKHDAESMDLQFQRDKVIRQFREAEVKWKMENRTKLQKAGGYALETANLIRSIKTSMDLSAVLRQGALIVFAHPIRGLKAMPSMFKALRSEKGRYIVDQEILHRPNYPLYEKSKLYLSEHGQKLSQMEEAYMSRWSDKIPGVAASQRAYTTFLNRLRADSFDAMVETLSRKKGKPTPEELNAISNFINVATGRGKIGLKETGSVGLNTAFFAPRYVASRFQYLAGQPLYGGTMATRAMIAQEYARLLTGIGIVYGLGTMAGGKIEVDPRSSDFGKIRFGNTRIDPLAGLSQSTVLVGRLATGETKTTTGRIQKIRGDIKYGGSDAADTIARFLRSKLAPVPAIGVDVATGRNYVGEPVDAAYWLKQPVPLAFGDIYETMKAQGVAAGTALALLSIFGVGIQTYEPKPRR